MGRVLVLNVLWGDGLDDGLGLQNVLVDVSVGQERTGRVRGPEGGGSVGGGGEGLTSCE